MFSAAISTPKGARRPLVAGERSILSRRLFRPLADDDLFNFAHVSIDHRQRTSRQDRTSRRRLQFNILHRLQLVLNTKHFPSSPGASTATDKRLDATQGANAGEPVRAM
jgi:hypothetical protein